MMKFLLVDDHVMLRSGIYRLLTEIFGLCTIDEAEDGAGTIEKLKHNKYDLIIMDIQMPKTDTLGLMEYIHIKYPGAKVLIFSISAETIYAKRFLKAGAKGFLQKDASLPEIKKAIEQILNNRRYISESLAVVLADDSISDTPANPFDKLSPREFEIARLLLAGETVSEISKSLNLQVSTVGTHKARLFTKLSINNVLELKELANNYNL